MNTIPRKIDRRIERTQQLLAQALMDLIIERGYDAISIQDIADRANVSRTTFYLHYKDKDELLFASMSQIYDQLVGSHEGFMPIDIAPADFETVECDKGDFQHVADYADFYRAMISKQGSIVFIMNVMSYLAEIMKPGLEARLAGREPKIPLDLIAAFCAGAEVGVMKWWLENDMPYTAEEMSRMQFFLSMFGLKWALGREEKSVQEKQQS